MMHIVDLLPTLLAVAGTKLDDSIVIAVRRNADGAQLSRNAAGLLYRLQGGRIRCRPAVDWPGVDNRRTDWLVCGNEGLLDPGEGLRADITLDVRKRSVVLHKDGTEFQIPVDDDELAAEAILGGLFAALSNAGLVDATARKISSARREMLSDLDDAGRIGRHAALA